jgi:hypothetical protein
VKAEVWMSLVRGSQGIIYFVHEFKPRSIEAGLLADPEMLAAVTAINRQIQSLAPVLNSLTIVDVASVESSSPEVPIETLVKRQGSDLYLFAVAMRPGVTTATFKIADSADASNVEVLGEDRSLSISGGQFRDTFQPWDVHLYRLAGQ